MRATVLAVVLVGVVPAVLLKRPDEQPPPDRARGAAVRGVPPRAPVARCRDSITAAGPHDPIVADDSLDNVAGPVRFSGLRAYTDWASLVREDQWIKTIAIVDAGLRVTLELPAEQRGWMRAEYGGRGGRAVTLQACRRRPTAYAGGFRIDYAKAPQQGRCAELIVWSADPRRVRLFDACA